MSSEPYYVAVCIRPPDFGKLPFESVSEGFLRTSGNPHNGDLDLSPFTAGAAQQVSRLAFCSDAAAGESGGVLCGAGDV